MTALKVDDRQNLVIGGDQRVIVYSPSEKQAIASFTPHLDTYSRFALDWGKDCFLIGGWVSPLTCLSAQTGVVRWRVDDVYRMDELAIHPAELVAIVSGVDTKPNRGVVVCDIQTGRFLNPGTPDRTIYRRLAHPSGSYEVDQYDEFEGETCLWGCRGRDGSFFEFWGPKVLHSYAFSPESLVMGGIDNSLTLVSFPSRTFKDVLQRSDSIAFGPMCYVEANRSFRVVVRLDDVLESPVFEVATDGSATRQLCSVAEDVIGVFFQNGKRICSESGDIYDCETGALLETLDFDKLLAS